MMPGLLNLFMFKDFRHKLIKGKFSKAVRNQTSRLFKRITYFIVNCILYLAFVMFSRPAY